MKVTVMENRTIICYYVTQWLWIQTYLNLILNLTEHSVGATNDDDDKATDTVSSAPLYQGSSLTLAASSGLIMKFKMRHNLTYEGLQDLLSLLKIHCPSPNDCITSVYKFRKQFGSSSAILHYFCSACYHNVTTDVSVCTNPLCKNNLTKEGGRSSFIEVPVAAQFQKLLERKYSSINMYIILLL